MPLSYRASHYRVLVARGKASEHLCACGAPAQDWAYQGGAECELVSESGTGIGCTYSENPDDYAAMCRSCHAVLDLTELKLNRLAKVRHRGAAVVNKMKRTCIECGLVSTPAGLRSHQIGSGHSLQP